MEGLDFMQDVVPAVIKYGPYAVQGAQFIGKHGPSVFRGVKRLANNLFSKQKRQNAKEYLKGLTKPKGMNRLVNDVKKGVSKASDYIASGKIGKHIADASNEANNMINMARPLLGNGQADHYSNMISQGANKLNSWNDTINKYNEQGRQLTNQFSKLK